MYVDEDDNPIFRETLLLQWVPKSSSSSSFSTVESKQQDTAQGDPKVRSLASIAKDMIVEKFRTRRTNATSWIDVFKSECIRVELELEKRWQIIRLFLEGVALDWYDASRQTLDHNNWDIWRNSFLDSFSDKGWSAARSAFSYKYISGSLGEYALKKQSLLINLHRNIDDTMKIYHIVTGLPISIQIKLDRSEISSTNELLHKLNALDLPVHPFSAPGTLLLNTSQPTVQFLSSAFNSLRPCNYCPYCLKKGRELLHSEVNCRNKAYDLANINKITNRSTSSNTIVKNKPEKPTVNNIELEGFLNEIKEESKNM